MIYEFRTSTYGMNIYLYGTNRLTARDGYKGVADGYYIPVQQYAATNPDDIIGKKQIDNAYAKGWINEQEYNETLSYIPTAAK